MDHHQEGMERQQQQQLVRERGRRIKAAVELGLARSSRGRRWGRRALVVAAPDQDAYPFEVTSSSSAAGGHLRPQRKKATSAPEEEEDDEVAVEEKVALLRLLVPGGEDMAVEGLLEETADYIAALRAQVGVMRALTCLLSGSGLDDLTEKAAAAGLIMPAEKPRSYQ